jgi:hypothetical protein
LFKKRQLKAFPVVVWSTACLRFSNALASIAQVVRVWADHTLKGDHTSQLCKVHELRIAVTRRAFKNPPLWSAGPLPRFPPPQTPFKTKVVVEGF